jgi:hypothetical protein
MAVDYERLTAHSKIGQTYFTWTRNALSGEVLLRLNLASRIRNEKAQLRSLMCFQTDVTSLLS